MLENVVLAEDRLVDYSDISITENTRGAYPIEFIHNAKIPCDANHDGALANEETERDPVFGLDVAIKCPNVPSEILIPRNVWLDKAASEVTAKKLASLFAKNFAAYEGGVSAEVKAAGANV